MKYKVCVMWYVAVYPKLQRTARRLGYSLAVHGSCKRDLDLVAIPWTDSASTATDLINAITKTATGIAGEPTKNPHGRLAWAICIGSTMYLDISVMARRPKRGVNA